MTNKRLNKNLATLGVLLILCCQYPILAFFNSEKVVFGIPSNVLYLFAVWVLAILMIFYYTSRLVNNKRS
jgi:hypothetical protein